METNESSARLIQEAVRDAKTLLRAEVQLAVGEARQELKAGKRAAILLGVALDIATVGLALLIVGLTLLLGGGGLAIAIEGGVLAVAAAIMALAGRKALPTSVVPRSRERLMEDVHEVRNHLPVL